MNAVSYLLARLKEPGTLRSLVWVLMSVAGLSVTDSDVAQFTLLASTLLGAISAAMPEKSTQAAEVVARASTAAQAAASNATRAAVVVQNAARVVDDVAAIVRPGKL